MTLLFIFILLFVMELAYFWIADHFNIIDKPNERSSHSSITLRGGGIVFYMGVLLYFVVDGFQYPWFFVGLTLIALVSFADDIHPQSSKLRLLVHFVAMILLFYQWGLFTLPWYFMVLALVFCTGILNAYNFMDGINGITGGYSMVVIGALWYVNNHITAFVDNKLIYIVLLALLVFNFFNFITKGKCFAGDVGASSIAFISIFLLGLLILKTKDLSYILFLVVYGVDTILTIIHRILLHENIFQAHRKHIFQLLANELHIPHVLVSLIFMLFQAIITVGFILTVHKSVYLLIVTLILSILYIALKTKYFHLHR